MAGTKTGALERLLDKSGEREGRVAAAAAAQHALLSEPHPPGPDLLRQLTQGPLQERWVDLRKATAGVIGVLSYRLGGPDYMVWLRGSFDESKSAESRALAAEALKTSLDCERRHGLRLDPGSMTTVASLVAKSLETAETGKVLVPLLDCALTIAALHSPIFAPHFKDVVDILIGWYIEVEQSDVVKRKCEEAMTAFRPFWLNELSFTLDDMLGQFLRDAQIYVHDSVVSEAPVTDPENILFKATLLLRATRLILEPLGPGSGEVWETFAKEATARVLSLLSKADYGRAWRDGAAIAAESAPLLRTLVNLSGGLGEAHATQALNALKLCLGSSLAGPSTLRLLSALKDLLTGMSTNRICLFMDELIGPQGCLLPLRFHAYAKVGAEVLQIYRNLLSPRSMEILQRAYKHVQNELLAAVKSLRGSECMESGGEEWPMVGREAEAIVVFNAAALSDLATAKNSLIGMWSVSPSLLELLLQPQLGLRSPRLATSSPGAHYALLHVLRAHCLGHDEFLASSSLVAGGGFMAESQTSGYLGQILTLLGEESALAMSMASRRLCLLWLGDIARLAVSSATSSTSAAAIRLLLAPEWHCALKAHVAMVKKSTKWENKEIVPLLAEVLSVSAHMLPDSFMTELLSTLLSLSGQGQPLYFSLLDHIPFSIISKHNWNSECGGGRRQGDMAVGGARISHAHFRLITAFILRRQLPRPLHSKDSLGRLMAEAGVKGRVLNTMEDVSSRWDWAVSETAALCVNSRLKTPLGKPVDTFLVIENEIKGLATETLKGRAREGAESVAVLRSDPDAAPPTNMLVHEKALNWFRVHRLLQFAEYLEKFMYNAYQGTAYALTPAHKDGRKFFHTNRKTCTDWLGRVRVAEATVALKSGRPALVARLAAQTLLDLGSVHADTLGGNLELLLLLTTEALGEMGAWEALAGLQAWLRARYPKVELRYLRPAMLLAQHHYEEALGLLQPSLDWGHREENKGPLPSSDSILKNQVLRCYTELRDWEGARAVLAQVQERDDVQYSHYLAKMASWDPLPATSNGDKSSGLAWCLWDRIRESEMGLAAVLEKEERKSAVEKVREEVEALETGLSWAQWPPQTHSHLEALRRLSQLILQPQQSIETDTLWQLEPQADPKLACLLSDWRSRLDGANGSKGRNRFLFDLGLARVLRKSGNYMASSKILLNYLPNSSCSLDSGWEEKIGRAWADGQAGQSEPWRWLPVGRLVGKLLASGSGDAGGSRAGFGVVCSAVTLVLERSMGAVLAQEPGQSLLQAVSSRLLTLSHSVGMPAMREELSRGILTLSNWLATSPELGEILVHNENSIFIKVVEEQLSITENYLGALDSGSIVGALLTLAASVCPELSKAQRAFADWAFNAGRKTLDGATREERVLLTSEELSLIQRALPPLAGETELDILVRIVSSVKSSDGGLESETQVAAAIGKALDIEEEYCVSLAALWAQANRRLFLFYDSAAAAYFAYLRFSGESESVVTMRATLRLLRLLVKHGDDLEPGLRPGFADSQPQVWGRVLPQLLSRLNHRSAFVRETLFSLLRRLGEAEPQTLAFPLLVTESEEAGEEDGEESSRRGLLQALGEAQPQLMADLRLFVTELERISLLREEKLHYVLSMLQPDFARRLRRVQEEEKITLDNDFLTAQEKPVIISEKTCIHTRMMFELILGLSTALREGAETPNEHSFLQLFSGHLEAMRVGAERMCRPSGMLTVSDVREAWAPCEEALALAAQRQPRGLDLRSLSPRLASLAGTRIPLPGRTETTVLVHAVRPAIPVLPSKTRPKKLTLVGSDGRQYAYLFKGQEDLHLDERIMQFLRVCNLMLAPKAAAQNSVQARHYSVTPLGPRSGLIEWVCGPVPIFSLYRRWQMRESAKQGALAPKHNEIYAMKMGKALGVKGAVDLNSRHKWSTEAQLSVLKELMAETPSDLVAKELWCRSGSPESWWGLTQAFASSNAVMSVIGYLLGLGDRHLDNLLLDLDTGEVVHIDYNVCFEKGTQLRVPETVPFRMTRNLQTALGLTGVEGQFRLGCESVAARLRAGRETLLTLLEAFVYDPLVDWTSQEAAAHHESSLLPPHNATLAAAAAGGDQSRDLESLGRQLARKLLQIRQKEHAVAWIANREELEKALLVFGTAAGGQSKALEDECRQREMVRRLEAETERRGGGLGSATPGALLPLSEEEVAVALAASRVALAQTRADLMAALEGTWTPLRGILATHHKLLAHARPAIKALATTKHSMEESNGKRNQFAAYLHDHKSWMDALVNGLNPSGEDRAPDLPSIQALIKETIDKMPMIYGALDGSGELAGAETEEWPERRREESRSAQGLAVWRRVRAKLEGRHAAPDVVLSVQDQMSQVIKEATSLKNLSLMYEGWTAWV